MRGICLDSTGMLIQKVRVKQACQQIAHAMNKTVAA